MLLKEYSVSADNNGRARRETDESNLPVNCVLQQILNVQRLVYDFFSSVKLNGRGAGETAEDATCDSSRIIQEDLLTEGRFKRYQYGATALDCSLMITFQRVDGHNLAIDEALASKFLVQQENYRFLSKITIMDLDPKPFTHAAKYVEQTRHSYQTEWIRRQAIF